LPDGLITPELVLQVAEAAQDYVVTQTEFTGIMATISSIFIGAFIFGAVGMVMGRFTEEMREAVWKQH